MSRNPRRIELTPGYLLHHRPWRDTSRILEVYTREHGRMTLFARGVRGPTAKLAAVLQPFQPLLLSFSGRGEAPALTGAERAHECAALPAPCLLAAFYLNELLLKLTTRHDPLPELFDHYHATLGQLRGGAPLEPALRLFEKRLLEVLGYGLDLSHRAVRRAAQAARVLSLPPGGGPYGRRRRQPGRAARGVAAGARGRTARERAGARGRAPGAQGGARRLS